MRYLPLTHDDRRQMLAKIGVSSVDDLFCDVPSAARRDGPIAGLSNHMPEYEVEQALANMAAKNLSPATCPTFLGAGAYRHHIPASVDQLLLRGEFLTSYTPYQPEVSQGTLQFLFEFQTQICMLTGMEVANASMYDGSTAAAEAVAMANRITGRKRVVLSGNLHPHYAETIATQGDLTEFTVVQSTPKPQTADDLLALLDAETSCAVVQNPDLFGSIHDYSVLADACHKLGILMIVVVTEVLSLGAIRSPGAMGADIVVGEGQGLGIPLSFGGPYCGFFATREKHIRQMPGRLCGQTVDAEGKRGFVLTLSTREQHIRRDKATSNICTSSVLCALGFTMHLSLLGELGLKQLANLNHAHACLLVDKLNAIQGCKVMNETFFNEFTLQLPVNAAAVVDRLASRPQPVMAGVPLSRLYPRQKTMENLLLVACTEMNDEGQMNALATALREVTL